MKKKPTFPKCTGIFDTGFQSASSLSYTQIGIQSYMYTTLNQFG